MRRTALALMPAACAIMSAVQCVVSPGGSVKRQRHHALGHLGPERRDARGPRLVAQQPVDAFLHEALLPAPHAGLRLAGPPHDLDGADAVGAQQDDLRPPDVLLRGVAVPDERLKSAARSDGETVKEIPVRMRQTRTATETEESQSGLFCQAKTTLSPRVKHEKPNGRRS